MLLCGDPLVQARTLWAGRRYSRAMPALMLRVRGSSSFGELVRLPMCLTCCTWWAATSTTNITAGSPPMGSG